MRRRGGALTLPARDPSGTGVFLAGVALFRRSSLATFKTGSAAAMERWREGGREFDGVEVAPFDLVTVDSTAAAAVCNSGESTLMLGASSVAGGTGAPVGEASLYIFRRFAKLRVGRLSTSSGRSSCSGTIGLLLVSSFRFFNNRLGLSATARDSCGRSAPMEIKP